MEMPDDRFSVFHTGNGNTLNNLFLEKHIYHQHRKNGNHGSRHQQRIICGIRPLEEIQHQGYRKGLRFIKEDQRIHKVVPLAQEYENSERGQIRLHQPKNDPEKDLRHARTVNDRRQCKYC